MSLTSTALADLKRSLWPPDAVRPTRLYGVFDCARDPRIFNILDRSYREHCCLFAGKLDDALKRAAPHLLELHAKESVTDELLRHGWNDAWGIVIQTEASFAQLRRHLRTFLRVQVESGRFLLFRYYDPRVLAVYLPTCTKAELQSIFGSEVLSFLLAVSGSEEVSRYSFNDECLDIQVLIHDVHTVQAGA